MASSARDRLSVIQRHLLANRGDKSIPIDSYCSSYNCGNGDKIPVEGEVSCQSGVIPSNLRWQSASVKAEEDGYDNKDIGASTIPRRRQDLLKWNGWGYKDSKFLVHKGKDYYVSFSGNRYKIGSMVLPHFSTWVIDTLGVNFDDFTPPQPLPQDYPQPIIQEDFLDAVRNLGITHSLDGEDRLFRAHGHTLAEVFVLREGMFPRLPDIVVWPGNHAEVEKLVELACKHQVVIIPIGGGTSVSGALLCPEEESRMIVSLDMSQMIFTCNTVHEY